MQSLWVHGLGIYYCANSKNIYLWIKASLWNTLDREVTKKTVSAQENKNWNVEGIDGID